jgi:hypothetical protein
MRRIAMRSLVPQHAHLVARNADGAFDDGKRRVASHGAIRRHRDEIRLRHCGDEKEEVRNRKRYPPCESGFAERFLGDATKPAAVRRCDDMFELAELRERGAPFQTPVRHLTVSLEAA